MPVTISRPRQASTSENALGPVRVVVVEDDEDYRAMISVLLERLPIRDAVSTRFFERVADAQCFVDEERVDVLLADFHLPDGTGADVVGHAQRVAPETRRIVLTATPADASAAVTESATPHAIWDKRLDSRELGARLLSLVCDVLERRPLTARP